MKRNVSYPSLFCLNSYESVAIGELNRCLNKKNEIELFM